MKCDGLCCRSACAMEKGHEGECRCGSPLGPDHMLPGQKMPKQVPSTLNQRLIDKSGEAYEFSHNTRVVSVRAATDIGEEYVREVLKGEDDRASQALFDRRGIRGTPCSACGGWGNRAYGSTSTWHGGVGGQMITNGICDKCWGSGDAESPGVNLRALERGSHERYVARKDYEHAVLVKDHAVAALRKCHEELKDLGTWTCPYCLEDISYSRDETRGPTEEEQHLQPCSLWIALNPPKAPR